MNRYLKAFIVGLIISIFCFIVSLFAFSGGAVGLIPVGIGLFFLLRYTIPALKMYQEEMGVKPISSKKQLLSRCSSIIDEYELPIGIGNQSCKSKVIGLIEESFCSYSPAIDDIEKQSRTLLLNKCYFLLSSGEFHIHFGTLNPNGIAPSLQKVYEGCAKWLLDKSHLTKEQYDENHRRLQENIDTVG